MQKKETILDEFFKSENIIYIEKDSRGQILETNNEEVIPIYSQIINSSIRDKNRYYHKPSKTWYKLIKRVVNGIDVEYLVDITEFQKELYYLKRDSLTGLIKDRNEASKLMEDYIDYAILENQSFSLLAADVDNFKEINDNFGHNCGDLVLKLISKIILSSTKQSDDIFDTRSSDIILRFGGDEFLILLKNVTLEGTKQKMEEISSKISNSCFSYEGKNVSVSISIGYSHFLDNEDKSKNSTEIRKVLSKKADNCLYQRKRNRTSN